MRALIEAVRRDHRDIRDVVDALCRVAAGLSEAPNPRDTERLRSMLHYLQVYLARYHHPKEHHLFAALRQVEPRFEPLLREYEAQHGHGAALLRELDADLARYEGRTSGSRDALQRSARRYAAFHRTHLRHEENALRSLTRREIEALDRLAASQPRRYVRPPMQRADIEAGFAALARNIAAPIR